MTWFPIGPDFVNQPRVVNYTRLSKRNQWGAQGRVNCISFESSMLPDTPAASYAVVTDTSGQCAAFRRRQSEGKWEPITDSLRQTNPNLDPSWIAVNPNNPLWIYMSTQKDQGIYVSNNRGNAGSWNAKVAVDGRVRKLIVDPRPVMDINDTILYAATDTGVYKSTNNGADWTLILSGDVWSLSFRIHPMTGGLHFYAGVFRSGIWYANAEPVNQGSWTNLSNQAIGLPAYDPGDSMTPANFDTILVDCCASNPATAYAWVTRPNNTGPSLSSSHTIAVYKTTAPTTSWTAAASPPVAVYSGGTASLDPYQGYANYWFGVSPNSSGDGSTDVLFFGSFGFARSINSGASWQFPETGFHADQQAIGFYPEDYQAGVNPSVYIGCDGGLGRNIRLADRTVTFDVAFPDDRTNSGPVVFPDSGIFINENEGLQNSLVYVLSCDPGGTAPPYIGCVDTGLAAKNGGGLGWRGFGSGDSFQLAVQQGADGVKIWERFHAGYAQRMSVGTDNGEFSLNASAVVSIDSEANSQIDPTSNFVLDTGGRCLTGATTEETVTTTTALVMAGSNVVIPVGSTATIVGSPYVAIGQLPNRQAATAQNIMADSFTVATLYQDKPAGTVIRPVRPAVCRVNQAGIASRISEFFPSRVVAVAANPAALPRLLACSTQDQRLYRVDGMLTDPGQPAWTEITNNKPMGIEISSMVVSANGDVYILLLQSVAAIVGGVSVTTPLFKISAMGDAWEALQCMGLPNDALADGLPCPFGKLVLDPVTPNRFFASYGGKVFTIVPDMVAGTMVWSISAPGLPGCLVSDLWAGRFENAAGGPPKVLLRAGVIGRGAWEADVTPGAVEPSVSLHIHRHSLDPGWFTRIWDSIPDPFHAGRRVYHYQCADLKIETPSIDGGGNTYFQTDPDASGMVTSTPVTPAPTISNVQFDLLRDGSEALPSGGKVRLHVQVYNRSNTALNDVNVWVLFTSAGAGLPALNSTTVLGTTFPFWDQFQMDGTILPALPVNSKWKQVGEGPVSLQGIDVSHPKVASWVWDVPVLGGGDLGHYCLGVFIHCQGSPIAESVRFNIDEISPDNRQVGQKNVHIVTMGMGGGGGMGGETSGGAAGGAPDGSSAGLSETITVDFHNGSDAEKMVALSVDAASFPKQSRQVVQLTPLKTAQPLMNSISGIEQTSPPGIAAMLWYWIKRFFIALFSRIGILKSPPRLLRPEKFLLAPGSLFEVKGVYLKPGEFVTAKISVSLPGSLKPGEECRIEVQQKEGRKLRGGSTFVFKCPPSGKIIINPILSEEDFKEMEEGNEAAYLPPWIDYTRRRLYQKANEINGRKEE